MEHKVKMFGQKPWEFTPDNGEKMTGNSLHVLEPTVDDTFVGIGKSAKYSIPREIYDTKIAPKFTKGKLLEVVLVGSLVDGKFKAIDVLE